jgi:uncharacterized protein (DUF952 family)
MLFPFATKGIVSDIKDRNPIVVNFHSSSCKVQMCGVETFSCLIGGIFLKPLQPNHQTGSEMKIYKVCSLSHWKQAQEQGVFKGVAIDISDGYIHFSSAEQLAETLAKHFAGQSNLVLLTIETDKLDGDKLKWEPSRGGQLFPHLYADLPLAAIIAEQNLQADQSGQFILPKEL